MRDLEKQLNVWRKRFDPRTVVDRARWGFLVGWILHLLVI